MMEEDRSHMTEKILSLTLEIIYLLTGEDYVVVKKSSGEPISGGWSRTQSPTMVPPPRSPIPDRNKEQKILELTTMMVHLMTGEDHGVMKKVSEGHKNLYKDVMMEDHQKGHKDIKMDNQPPLTSPDGSSHGNPPKRCHGDDNIDVKEEYTEEDEEYGVMEEFSEEQKNIMEPPNTRNPPERCPCPLYSQDSTQEDHSYTQHAQGENLENYNIVVKEEYKEEDEEYGVMEEFSEGHKDMMELPNTRNPPERCPRPLYSRDSTQEGHTIPHHHQVDGSSHGNPPERCPRPLYSRDSTQEDQCYEDEEHVSRIEENEDNNQRLLLNNPTYKEEEILPEVSADGCDVGNSSEVPQIPSADLGGGNNGIPTDPQKESPYFCLKCGQSFKWKTSLERHMRVHTGETFQCEECGKCFRQKDRLTAHLRIHTGEKLHICTECGKCFVWKDSLIRHLRIHTGEKPYSCPDCDKRFTQKSNLWSHQKVHIEKTSLTFLECGKSCDNKSELSIHQLAQAEKMLSCSECGKLCVSKSELTIHQRSHTGEMPFSCPECGKCFSRQGSLTSHMKLHTGDKPFSCPECGKAFSRKSELAIHLNGHTGQHRFSCSECGKGFSHKERFRRHQRTHTGERPYTCSECGKGYQQNSHLLEHLRRHAGACPFPCPLCGKCFPLKSALDKHQSRHTGLHPDSYESYIDQGSLRRRRKSHTGQRPLS